MILKKIIIENMFAYSGKIEINLEPDGEKNIILIGARNGRGKTSFLRILRILIHGLKGNSEFTKNDIGLTSKEYALGKNKKWEGIFYKHLSIKKASIKAVLELENKELIISRSFIKSSIDFSEELTLLIDGKSEYEPQSYLDNILPKHLAQFFFFDGEKLESIINTQKLNIKDSLEVLLNIKTYDKLLKYFKDIQKEYKTDTNDSPTSEEIQKLYLNVKSIEEDIKILNNQMNREERELKLISIDIEEIDDKLIDLVADQRVDIKPLKNQKIEIDSKLKKLKKDVVAKLRTQDFFLLMVEDLSRDYLESLDKNQLSYELAEQLKYFKRALNVIIPQIQNNIFDPDTKNIPPEYNLDFDTMEYYQDRIKEESDKAWDEYRNGSSKKKANKQEIYYIEDDKEVLKNVFESKSILYKNLTEIKDLNKKLKDINSHIEDASEDVNESSELISKHKADKQKLESQKSNFEQKKGRIRGKIEELQETKKETNVTINKKEKELIHTQPILNSIELSEKLISFFSKFKSELLNRKINSLENKFNENLFELAYDKKWIKFININSKFEIKLINFLEQEISLNSLSAGQKQILATALIKSLSEISEVKSFICIDTPLARIDLENRKSLIENYYPKASKQVIILSTNSEIDPSKSEYKLMKKFIAKEYTIISEKYESAFESGYFNEIKRS